ncbi:MAG: phenylalanine--tRNA ligase subunit alpha [Candidatus Heimdallarchaeaceae archaeon]
MNDVNSKIVLPAEVMPLLEILGEKKQVSINSLKSLLNESRGKIEYLLGFLSNADLIKRTDHVRPIFKLTESGKIASVEGLIERRILDLLRDKKIVGFGDLFKKFNVDKREINAGVGELKKLGVIKIESGKISLTNDIDVNKNLQETLEKIAVGKLQESNASVDILVKRRLVVIEEEKETIIELKLPYSELKEKIEVKKERSRLTPEMIRTGQWKSISLKRYNLSVSPPTQFVGRKQPYLRFLDEVKKKLVALGFQEMRGPIVEMEFWNFDALFQAQDHPAREWSDVYRISDPSIGKLPPEAYVDNVKKAHENGYTTGSRGWRYKWDPMKAARLVLRAQGTSVSARTLVGLPVPSKFFSISRCYRPDEVDATHLAEFNQVEGIVADPSLTFRDLLGILEVFAVDIADAKNPTFSPDYYPFTEPSVELSVEDPVLGRIEFGGAGIFRPEVTKPFGIDVPVIAWGLGIDRLFMVKYGITDIRELFSYKLSWLRNAKVV